MFDQIFLQIGAMLKEKFDGAHEVKQKRKNGRRMLVTKFSRFKNHKDTDLVYLVTSPDYCEYDVKKGSLGTSGRECDPVSFNRNSSWSRDLQKYFYSRNPRELTGATCCAATAATPPGERGGRRGAGVSSTGAAMWSARSVSEMSRSPPATNNLHLRHRLPSDTSPSHSFLKKPSTILSVLSSDCSVSVLASQLFLYLGSITMIPLRQLALSPAYIPSLL